LKSDISCKSIWADNSAFDLVILIVEPGTTHCCISPCRFVFCICNVNSFYVIEACVVCICRAEQFREGMGPVVPTSGTTVQLELGPPFKKLRFGELKPEVQQPLRIDTRVSFI
jgi:hypothetical protein